MLDALRSKKTLPRFDPRAKRDLARLLAKFDLPIPEGDPRVNRGPNAADRVREVYQLRADVRDVFPLGLTPAQLGDYGDWLLRYGRSEYGFTADEILCFLFDQADDPSKGLEETYLLAPEWQCAVPDAFTEHGWDALQRWLTKRYCDRVGRWIRSAQQPARYRVQAPPASPRSTCSVTSSTNPGCKKRSAGKLRHSKIMDSRPVCAICR